MTHAVLSLLKESKHPMRIDLIGVAGSGMSGLAWLLMALGHKVSGSDKATTLETERLQKAGLTFFPTAHGARGGGLRHGHLLVRDQAGQRRV